MRSHRQALAEGHDFPPAHWRPEGRKLGDRAVLVSSPQTKTIILSHPHPSGKLRTLFSFLPPPSLPFLFLKKIAARQKGPSCGGLWLREALSKAPPVLGTPSWGRRWPPGTLLTLPRCPRGSLSRASRCNSGSLMRRRKDPALIPNSENHVSTQTPDADAVAATVSPTARPLNSRRTCPLGSPSCSAIPQAGLRMRRWSGKGFQTSKGRR